MKNSNWQISFVIFLMALCVNQQLCLSKSKEVRIDASTKKQLTKFFTNVAHGVGGVGKEGGQALVKGKITNSRLVAFGIAQSILSNEVSTKVFHYKQGAYQRLSAKYIEASVAKYFGKRVKHQSVGNWQYKGGYYTGDPTEFEFGGSNVTVTKLIDNGSGIYTVHLVEHGMMDGDPDVRKQATIKKKAGRYTLIDYKKA